MWLTRLFYKGLKIFEYHATHQGIALGISAGLILAWSGWTTLQFWVIGSCLFFIQFNLGATLLSYLFFTGVGYVGNQLFFSIGNRLLTQPKLLRFWSFLYDMPVIPYTNFYVPTTLGKWVLATLLAVPLFWVSMKVIKLTEAAVYHWWRTTKLYTLYRAYKPYA